MQNFIVILQHAQTIREANVMQNFDSVGMDQVNIF